MTLAESDPFWSFVATFEPLAGGRAHSVEWLEARYANPKVNEWVREYFHERWAMFQIEAGIPELLAANYAHAAVCYRLQQLADEDVKLAGEIMSLEIGMKRCGHDPGKVPCNRQECLSRAQWIVEACHDTFSAKGSAAGRKEAKKCLKCLSEEEKG